MIGAFVSIAIAKMTFGGLGKNPFNPALVGRVFLLFAYPVQMTTFPRPVGQLADAFRERRRWQPSSGAGVAYVGQLSGCPFRFDPRFAG